MLAVVAAWAVHNLCMLTEFSRKIYARMTLLQIVTLQVLMISMIALPVKMLLRLALTIKYVWVTPWFNV